jgi:hypothetical protein
MAVAPARSTITGASAQAICLGAGTGIGRDATASAATANITPITTHLQKRRMKQNTMDLLCAEHRFNRCQKAETGDLPVIAMRTSLPRTTCFRPRSIGRDAANVDVFAVIRQQCVASALG